MNEGRETTLRTHERAEFLQHICSPLPADRSASAEALHRHLQCQPYCPADLPMQRGILGHTGSCWNRMCCSTYLFSEDCNLDLCCTAFDFALLYPSGSLTWRLCAQACTGMSNEGIYPEEHGLRSMISAQTKRCLTMSRCQYFGMGSTPYHLQHQQPLQADLGRKCFSRPTHLSITCKLQWTHA